MTETIIKASEAAIYLAQRRVSGLHYLRHPRWKFDRAEIRIAGFVGQATIEIKAGDHFAKAILPVADIPALIDALKTIVEQGRD